MSYKVNIIFERDEAGFYAYAPDLPGCHSQGETFDDVSSNIREAVELYLSVLSEEEKEQMLSKEILSTTIDIQLV
ncbi:MAG: type II toxin-antitoxin system HicB family antitoxin [Bacteroidetes bacterium]|nr:type II toxin-antitoxin system HicB family antitoxin [Bacteroidota bacterium]